MLVVGASLLLTPTLTLAATVRLSGHLGNAESGKLVHQATQVAGKSLVGPKGSGLTRGITSTSIDVGCVTSVADYPLYQQGLEGAFDQVNAKGGVFGRKIHVSSTCSNDNATASTDTTDVEQLVQQTQVFAVMSLSDVILPGSTNFLNSHQVPFYGWGFDPGFCGTRWGFGWNGCLAGNGVTEPLEAISGNLGQAIFTATGISPKGAKVALQSETGTAGKIGLDQYDAVFKALGATIVYSEANMPVTDVTDMTPYVTAVLAAKPQVILAAPSFASSGPFVSALRAAGFTGPIFTFTSYIPGLLQATKSLAASLNHEYVDTQVVPEEENTPYIALEKSALRDAHAASTSVTLGAAIGYAEATLFIEQLKAIGKTLNTKTFDQKINGKGFTGFTGVKGGPGKIHWPAGHYLPSDCSSMVQVTGTNYKVVVPFKCFQSYKVDK